MRDSRPSADMIRRRRACPACGVRFTTFEVTTLTPEADAADIPQALLLHGLLRDIPQPMASLLQRLITAMAKREASLSVEHEDEVPPAGEPAPEAA